VRVLKRCVDVVIVLVTASFALMTFETGRQIGLSLFAWAGLAGLVVAFAAYPLIKNLIAGVQLAMTQPIRIGDTVAINGQTGKVEDITASSAVIRLADERRSFVPLNFFMEKPFQKSTREGSEIIGTISLPTSGSAPVERLREKLTDVVSNDPLWDGKIAKLEAAGAKDGRVVELRAAVSARSSREARNLSCSVREKLIGFLRREHPDALPVTATVDPNRLTRDELDLLSLGDGIDISFDQLAVLNDGTLAYKDHRILLYIRDVHVFGNKWRQPRYHLSHCKALKKMTENGRIKGYAVAAEANGFFKINMVSAGTSKSERRRLTVCQNCLDTLSFDGFNFQWDHRKRKEFVKAFTPDRYFAIYPRSLHTSKPTGRSVNAPVSEHAA
jgi:small-conductance mechanosensitive channel